MKLQSRFLAAILFLLPPGHLLGGEVVHHDLRVRLFPDDARIEVEDQLTLPRNHPYPLQLHAGMQPTATGGTLRPHTIRNQTPGTTLKAYTLRPDAGHRTITLHYAGRIHDPLQTHSESLGRRRQMTRGIIDREGVFLDGNSSWYPLVPDTLQSFRMEVHLPEGWLAISQGAGPRIETMTGGVEVHWQELQPQDDIYLVAAPFRLHREAKQRPEAQVYLRDADDALAQRYLQATHRYIDLYSRLIGPYPYAKFALVENFWETGYGMPSFTLLGSRVIRLPFIVHTSYPHEILHNWWGNGVYIDYESGNWSEGLTAYLADYLLKEQGGKGRDYRRNALQRYASFVNKERDFPIARFRSRHSGASQAVGYDKALMVFHMLRRRLGDPAFIAGLRRFYKDNLFERAGFDDLQRAFETESGVSLDWFFRQWIHRTGAPALAIDEVKVKKAGDRFQVSARLSQTQTDEPFTLRVPVVLHRTDVPPVLEQVTLEKRHTRFTLESSTAPLRLDIDPAFDLFRQLAAGETPPVLHDMLGAEDGLVVLPARAPESLYAAYRALAEAWRTDHPRLRIVDDDRLHALPDQPVWLLGWSNRFLQEFRAQMEASGAPARIEKNHAEIAGRTYPGDAFSLAMTLPHADTSRPVAWVATSDTKPVRGLTRKLPHYGKYSYVVFSGDAPTIQSKGVWPAADSSLKIPLAPEATRLPAYPPEPPPLLESLDKETTSRPHG